MPSPCASASIAATCSRVRRISPRVLGGDVLVAAREREQLEDERDEVGVLAHGLLQVLRHQVDEVVGRLRPGELLLEQLHTQLAVAPDGLDEQLLLGAEVVVQQAPRDAGLARDVVEGRAGSAARARRCGASPRRCAGPSHRRASARRPRGRPPRRRSRPPRSPAPRRRSPGSLRPLRSSLRADRARRPARSQARARPESWSSCSRTPPRPRTAGRAPSSAGPR